jgi:hypothetical protein
MADGGCSVLLLTGPIIPRIRTAPVFYSALISVNSLKIGLKSRSRNMHRSIHRSNLTKYYCDFCNFQCFNTYELLKHIRRCHENDPKFLVYCHVCGSSFKKWETLRKHIQRSSCHNAIEPETGKLYH